MTDSLTEAFDRAMRTTIDELRVDMARQQENAFFRIEEPRAINYLIQSDNAARIPIERIESVTTPVAAPATAPNYTGSVYTTTSGNQYTIEAPTGLAPNYGARSVGEGTLYENQWSQRELARYEARGLITWPNGEPARPAADPNEPLRAVWCGQCGAHTGLLLPQSQHPRSPRCDGCTDLPQIRWMNRDLDEEDTETDNGAQCACGSTEFYIEREFATATMYSTRGGDGDACLYFDEPTPDHTDSGVYCIDCGDNYYDACVHF